MVCVHGVWGNPAARAAHDPSYANSISAGLAATTRRRENGASSTSCEWIARALLAHEGQRARDLSVGQRREEPQQTTKYA